VTRFAFMTILRFRVIPIKARVSMNSMTARNSNTREAPRYCAPKNIPWRERENVALKDAAETAGISVASLYRFEAQGRIRFIRLAGRTLVPTVDLIALLASAETWSASSKGAAARAARLAPADKFIGASHT
jgi:hypothetical protein